MSPVGVDAHGLRLVITGLLSWLVWSIGRVQRPKESQGAFTHVNAKYAYSMTLALNLLCNSELNASTLSKYVPKNN